MATMEITTRVKCPLACTFCPQHNLIKAYRDAANTVMTLETFSTILNKLPPHVRIDFSGMVEPWSNPLATKMLEMSVKDNRRVAVYTTLMGMTRKDADVIERLFKVHPDNFVVFCLHLPDKKMNMKGYRRSDEYIEVLKNFLEMKKNGIIPTQKFEMMCMDPDNYHGQVHDDIKDLVPELSPWNGHSRAGNLNNEKVEKIGAVTIPKNDFSLVCSMTPFYDHNVILPNGDVVLCCMDYSMKHVLGNLLDEGFTYYDLFKSEELEKVRIANQKPCFSDESLCKTCNSVRRPSEYYVPK